MGIHAKPKHNSPKATAQRHLEERLEDHNQRVAFLEECMLLVTEMMILGPDAPAETRVKLMSRMGILAGTTGESNGL